FVVVTVLLSFIFSIFCCFRFVWVALNSFQSFFNLVFNVFFCRLYFWSRFLIRAIIFTSVIIVFSVVVVIARRFIICGSILNYSLASFVTLFFVRIIRR